MIVITITIGIRVIETIIVEIGITTILVIVILVVRLVTMMTVAAVDSTMILLQVLLTKIMKIS